MTGFAHKSIRRYGLVAAAAAALLLAGACASKSNSPGSGGTHGTSAVTVQSMSGPVGDYLVDGGGKTLYLFASDSATSSTCSGGCATAWPPVTVSGTATAGGSAAASMLGTLRRADGTTQVTYNGHPLYYYAGDAAAGDMNGQGSSQFGAQWWMLSPQGAAITATPAPAASSTGGSTGWA